MNCYATPAPQRGETGAPVGARLARGGDTPSVVEAAAVFAESKRATSVEPTYLMSVDRAVIDMRPADYYERANLRSNRSASKTAARVRGPFGLLLQAEQKKLVRSGMTHVEIAAFITLRVRSGADGVTRDGLTSLARWAGMSERTMRRALRNLVTLGVVVRTRSQRHGGPKGTAWSWARCALALHDWPDSVANAHGDPEEGAASTALFPRRSRPLGEEEPVKAAPRDGQLTSCIPEHLPDTSLDDVDKTIRCALMELQAFTNYPFDRVLDHQLLMRAQRDRPNVDIAVEVERWIQRAVGQQMRVPRAALEAWLKRAQDTPQADRERYCTHDGCIGRGRGERGVCMSHLASLAP